VSPPGDAQGDGDCGRCCGDDGGEVPATAVTGVELKQSGVEVTRDGPAQIKGRGDGQFVDHRPSSSETVKRWLSWARARAR
jgi:hypothetical protein